MDDEQDVDALLSPFIRDWLQQQLKVVTLGGGAALASLRRHLDALDSRIAEREAQGQLSLLPWTSLYAARAGFEPGNVLGAVDVIFSNGAQDERYAGMRLVGEMDWVVSAAGGSPDVAAYERGLYRLVNDYAQSALCVYDLHRLSGVLLLQILSVHPLALMGGELLESPFYREQP